MGLGLYGLANLMGDCTPPARSFAFDLASTLDGIDRQKTAKSGRRTNVSTFSSLNSFECQLWVPSIVTT